MLRGDRDTMLSRMRMYTMDTSSTKLKIVAWKGWILDSKKQKEKWRAGKMSEEEYCQEVVQDLIEWNNASKSPPPRPFHDYMADFQNVF